MASTDLRAEDTRMMTALYIIYVILTTHITGGGYGRHSGVKHLFGLHIGIFRLTEKKI